MAINPKPSPSDGNRHWYVKTAPTVEPILIDELKLFARIDGTAEDTLLKALIVSVRQAAEAYLGRALITQTMVMVMDFWPSIVIPLPRPPLLSVVQVRTLDEDDTATVYDADNYFLQLKDTPGTLVIKNGVSAPENTARYTGGYEVEFTAGYGIVGTAVPQAIRDALLMWAAIVYEERLPVGNAPPAKAMPLMSPYKVLRI